MRDTIFTNKSGRGLGYPLLITEIVCHFEVDLSGEQVEHTNNGDIISGFTSSQAGFKYDEKEKKKRLLMAELREKKGPKKTFGLKKQKRTKDPQDPSPTGKEVIEEKDEDENEEEK